MTTVNTIGRVTRDIVVQYAKGSGKPYVKFYLDATEGSINNQTSICFSCVIFGDDAERIVKAGVRKNSVIQVNGRLSVEEFDRKNNGGRGYSLKLINISWGYVPTGAKKSSNENTEMPPAPKTTIVDEVEEVNLDEEDDLPF